MANKEKDIFAPPTPEEEAIFAPPTQLPEDSKDISTLKAAALGAGQGLTFGFSDEAIGALKALSELPESDESFKDLYERYRDLERKALEQAAEQHPLAYYGSDVAAGMAIPGMGLIKSAPSLGKLLPKLGIPASKTAAKQAVKEGAIVGGVTGLGVSEAEISDVGQLAADVGVGTALGGGIAKLGTLLTPSPKKLEQSASEKLLNVLGARTKDIEKEFGKGRAGKVISDKQQLIGKEIEELGLIGVKGSSKEIADAIGGKIESLEETLDPLIRRAAFTPSPHPSDLPNISNELNEVLGPINRQILKGAPERHDAYIKNINPLIDDIKANADNIIELQEIKKSLNKELGPGAFIKTSKELTDIEEAKKNILNVVRERILTLAEKSDPNIAKQLKETNETLSDLFTAHDIVSKKAAQEAAKKPTTWRDLLPAAWVGGAMYAGQPLLAGGILGVKGAEAITGKSAPDLAKTILAKGQLKLAKQPEEKVSTAIQTLLKPSTEATYAAQSPVQYEPLSKEQLTDISNKVTQKYGAEGEQLANMLRDISEKDGRRRQALSFLLSQDPRYKKMLKDL